MNTAIEVTGLCKSYGDHDAVVDVGFSVPAGTVFGLLGPNGAGKTTTVRMLSTLLPMDAGHATVAGFDLARQPHEVRARIGLTGQFAAVDERLTARENLVLVGRLYHLGKRRANTRADDLLGRFDLTEAANRPLRMFSGGMRRRLDLALSLIAEPPVLFLDEPTTGLDLTSRLALWEMIREQVADGATVLLTTQYLEEADQLAGRVAVIRDGRVVADDTPDALKQQVGEERLELTVRDPATVQAATRALAAFSSGAPAVGEDGRTVSAPLAAGIKAIAMVSAELHLAGVDVVDFAIRRPSLDDVFLSLTRQTKSEVAA